jgi:hypothetical protein
MFEARLSQSGLLKKIIEAIKDIVSTANLDFGPEGLSLQVSDGFSFFKKALKKITFQGNGFFPRFLGFFANSSGGF